MTGGSDVNDLDDEKTHRFIPEAFGDEVEGQNVKSIMDDPKQIEKIKRQQQKLLMLEKEKAEELLR